MKWYLIEKYVIWNILGIILFKIVLEYSYINFTVPYYESMGFTMDFNIIKYIMGWVIYILLFQLLYIKKEHTTYLILLFVFILLITPTIILFAFKNEPYTFFYYIILTYGVIVLFISKKIINLRYLPYSKEIAVLVSILLVVTVLIHYMITVGFQHINFDMSKVYELRRSSYAIESNTGIFGYLNPWVTKVFNIFLISIALYKRKYLWLIIFLAFQMLLFGFSGHKTVIFIVSFILIVYLLDKIKYQTTLIIYGVVFFLLAILFYFYITEELLLPAIFINRAFYVPANLNYVYMDYFSTHPHTIWSNSFLRYFIDSPYSMDPVFVIGDYLGYPEMSANTGIFGTGYMHLGIFGLAIYSLLTIFFLNLTQQFTKIPIWINNSIVLMPFLTLFISSDLVTTLLTHGLFISIILLYLYSSVQQNN